ncbi:hypothetical protein EJ08DRAFT_649409, partial [Tothia fuscella]
MHTLSSLPEDILIIICRELLIQDIFHLGSTNHILAKFVLNNSTYICHSIARNTFPNATLLVRLPASGPPDFTWLKSLVPKYLAGVLVDRYRLASPYVCFDIYYIPIQSPIGDLPRARIENGLCVSKRLSDICLEVYRQPHSHVPKRPLKVRLKRALLLGFQKHPHGSTVDITKRRERETLRLRMTYLYSLERRDIEDYELLLSLLYSAFRTNQNPKNDYCGATRPRYVGLDIF